MKEAEDKGNGRKVGASQKATIFDVAERAGVSFVSVSRVFNEHPNVSHRMRDRVLRAARVVGYQPRLVCRPNVIALLVDNHDGMNGRCNKYQLCSQLFLQSVQRNFRLEVVAVTQLDLLTQHSVDGIIEVETTGPQSFQTSDLPNVPIVLTHHRTLQSHWSSVTIDFQHEGCLAAGVLLKKHHRKIAVLMDNMDHWSTGERKKGILQALRKARLPPETVTYFSLGEHGVPSVCEAVHAGNHTALLNFSNKHVLELMDHMFNNLRWSIPEDLSVLSLDNTRFCEHYHPRISSITQPLPKLAEQAMDELIHLIQKTNGNRNHLLKSTYHERDSCLTLPSPGR